MSTSIPAGPFLSSIPAGPFLWRAQVLGELCDCTVDWAWDFTPETGFSADAPTVVACGRHVAVLATLSDGAAGFDPVSPGVLELTASVTCGTETTTLDPITLTLTEDGAVVVPHRYRFVLIAVDQSTGSAICPITELGGVSVTADCSGVFSAKSVLVAIKNLSTGEFLGVPIDWLQFLINGVLSPASKFLTRTAYGCADARFEVAWPVSDLPASGTFGRTDAKITVTGTYQGKTVFPVSFYAKCT